LLLPRQIHSNGILFKFRFSQRKIVQLPEQRNWYLARGNERIITHYSYVKKVQGLNSACPPLASNQDETIRGFPDDRRMHQTFGVYAGGEFLDFVLVELPALTVRGNYQGFDWDAFHFVLPFQDRPSGYDQAMRRILRSSN
jgi:hypothetical protein